MTIVVGQRRTVLFINTHGQAVLGKAQVLQLLYAMQPEAAHREQKVMMRFSLADISKGSRMHHT